MMSHALHFQRLLRGMITTPLQFRMSDTIIAPIANGENMQSCPKNLAELLILAFLSCMRMFIMPIKFPPCNAARVDDLDMNSSYNVACRRLRRHITTCSCFPGNCFSTSCRAKRRGRFPQSGHEKHHSALLSTAHEHDGKEV